MDDIEDLLYLVYSSRAVILSQGNFPPPEGMW